MEAEAAVEDLPEEDRLVAAADLAAAVDLLLLAVDLLADSVAEMMKKNPTTIEEREEEEAADPEDLHPAATEGTHSSKEEAVVGSEGLLAVEILKVLLTVVV